MSDLRFSTVHRYEGRPRFTVKLEHGGRSTVSLALLDTGAAFTAFDNSIARELGIDLASGPTQLITGVEMKPLRVPRRFVALALSVQGINVMTATTSVLFLPNLRFADNVIGRDLLRDIPFAMIHHREELHLGLMD